jgi:soluble lytic murein transglycosylase
MLTIVWEKGSNLTIYTYMGIFFDPNKKEKGSAPPFDAGFARSLSNTAQYDLLLPYLEKYRTKAVLLSDFRNLYYPMPKKYLDIVIKNLPPYIRTLPPEDVKDFILLVFAIMHRESKFNPHAKSKKGALGLMQLMPDTAKWFAKDFLGMTHYNLKDPNDNIKIGTAYLSYIIENSGGMDFLSLNLASWNFGPGASHKLMHSNQSKTFLKKLERVKETHLFLQRVKANYQIYRSVYGNNITGLASAKSKFKHKPAVLVAHNIVIVPKGKVRPETKAKVQVAAKAKVVALVKVKKVAPQIVTAPKFRVQVASFKSAKLAEQFKEELAEEKGLSNIHIVKAIIEDDEWLRVQVWFNDKASADKFLVSIKEDYPTAWLPGQ